MKKQIIWIWIFPIRRVVMQKLDGKNQFSTLLLYIKSAGKNVFVMKSTAMITKYWHTFKVNIIFDAWIAFNINADNFLSLDNSQLIVLI